MNRRSGLRRQKPLRSDPEKIREWRRRGARNYEERLREEGRKFSDMKRSPINPVNRERRERERLRAYGPEERRDFVTDLPCEACGRRGDDIHQAHIETGGIGRKADYDTVVPLCSAHHMELDAELGDVDRFDAVHGTDLRAAAARVEEEWRDFLRNEEAA